MIKELYIQNYALIAEARLSFGNGFISVTGESGAGKTLMLGALNLISGVRADFDVIRKGEEKTVVEAVFEPCSDELIFVIKENSLDAFEQVIIRRELTRAGRSRAFVNDSPVSLSLLKEVTDILFQVHGQHENLIINKSKFQFNQVDGYADQLPILREFQELYKKYQSYKREYNSLIDATIQVRKDQDYFQFQFDELNQLDLNDAQYLSFEEEYNLLEHAEEIIETLTTAQDVLFTDSGVDEQLDQVRRLFASISTYTNGIKNVAERFESIHIELSDLEKDIDQIKDSVDADPKRKRILEERLDELNKQYIKHSVSNIDELKLVLQDYTLKLASIDSFGEELERLEGLTEESKNAAKLLALSLANGRREALEGFTDEVNGLLKELGMPKAEFRVQLKSMEEMNSFGIDEIEMLFNANDSTDLKPISDVASGGEVSRIMLSLKAIHSDKNLNQSMVFDEIDTGVSGEVAKRMGKLMKQLSNNGQIIAITHSPGVAAQGNDHVKIFKEEQDGHVVSMFKTLSEEERILELAAMYSGNHITDAAIESARLLRKS